MSQPHLRSFTIATYAAAVGAALVFAVAPSVATARAPRAAPKTKVGPAEVTAKVTRTDDGWAIDVVATNASDADADCTVALALTRRTNSPMARVRPAARSVWQAPLALSVPAHGKVEQRVELPANIAADLTAVEVKDAKAAHDPDAFMASTVEFAVVVNQGGIARVKLAEAAH